MFHKVSDLEVVTLLFVLRNWPSKTAPLRPRKDLWPT